MTLDDIKAELERGRAWNIEVHSVELAIYVPYRVDGEHRQPLTDARGASLCYPSRYAALKALKRTGLTHVDVVHVSSYDEMIGVPSTPGQSEMREQVVLAHIQDR